MFRAAPFAPSHPSSSPVSRKSALVPIRTIPGHEKGRGLDGVFYHFIALTVSQPSSPPSVTSTRRSTQNFFPAPRPTARNAPPAPPTLPRLLSYLTDGANRRGERAFTIMPALRGTVQRSGRDQPEHRRTHGNPNDSGRPPPATPASPARGPIE